MIIPPPKRHFLARHEFTIATSTVITVFLAILVMALFELSGKYSIQRNEITGEVQATYTMKNMYGEKIQFNRGFESVEEACEWIEYMKKKDAKEQEERKKMEAEEKRLEDAWRDVKCK
jgi:hypothetical protein